jgi:hypothetical protein
MGKGGDLACDIVNHCAFQAQLGRSDLGYEKRLVKRIHIMCWGGCGEEDDSDDEYDDDYEIPKEITVRMLLECPLVAISYMNFRPACFNVARCSRGSTLKRYARS